MLVLNLPAFENKNITAYDRLNGRYGEILTKKKQLERLDLSQDYLAM